MLTHSTLTARLTTLLLLATTLLFSACGEGTFEEDGGVDVDDTLTSSLSSSQRRQRVTLIKRAAAEVGLNNAVLLAGIANSETYLAHCWSELTWACKGPASSSCGGGPVVAGSGDGPCSLKQGGLGYFQFDAGTHNQTIATYGRDVLTVEGNTHHAVEFVIDKVIRSVYISGVSNRAQALAWLNSVRVDGKNWTAWIKTVTHYYNGCVPGRCSVYNQRFNKYSNDTRAVYKEFGHDFWYGGGGGSTTPPASLSVPKGLTPEVTSLKKDQYVPLAWKKVSGATSYQVNMQYSPDGKDWKLYYTWKGRSSNQFNVWPQILNNNYRWRVRACNSNGCSKWSGFAHLVYGNPSKVIGPDTDPTPQPTGIQPPTNLKPGSGSFATPSVKLSWTKASGATTYDINMQYKRSGTWTQYYTWKERSGSSFTVWPQVDNTSYRWRIRSCKGNTCSKWSSFKTFSFTGK